MSGGEAGVPIGGFVSGLEILSRDNGGLRYRGGLHPRCSEMQDLEGGPRIDWQDPASGGP